MCIFRRIFIYFLYVSFGIAPVLTGCGSDDKGQSRDILEQAENLLHVSPDSSLLLIQSVDKKLLDKKSHAQYALLLSRILYENGFIPPDDSLLRQALPYYERCGNREEKAALYFLLGESYRRAGLTGRAVNAYVTAVRYVKDTEDNRLKGLICTGMGYMLGMQYEFGSALQYYDKAIELLEHSGDTAGVAAAVEAKARLLYLTGKYEDVFICHTKVLEYAQSKKDTARILKLSRNLAAAMICSATDPRCAETYLRDVYRQYRLDFSVKDYPLLSLMHLKNHCPDSARFYALLSMKGNEKLSPRQKAGLYALLSKIESGSGRFRQALLYNRKGQRIIDSAIRAEKENSVLNLEQTYRARYTEHSFINMKKNHLLLAAVLFLLLAVTGSLVFIFIRNRELRLEKRNVRLREYTRYIESQKDDNIRSLKKSVETRLENLKKLLDIACLSGDNPDLLYRKLKNYLQLEPGESRRAFADILEIANLYNHGLIDYLKAHYPSLKYEDLCLCGMISLGFSADGICLIFNLASVNSLYNKRCRLRKRMDIPAHVNIETFILELTEKMRENQNQGSLMTPVRN